MACAGSLPPLHALLRANADLRAVAVPEDDRSPAGGAPPEIVAIARRAGVPVVPIPNLQSAAVEAIAAYAPDLIVVACFPWRLPRALRDLPRYGCLNLHPSLLPKGRGPEPIFWTLRRGERQTGVTLHQIDAGFDSGPVLAQATVPVPFGVRAPALEHHLMTLGGDLLVDLLPRFGEGTIEPIPQEASAVTVAPVPGAVDWLVPTTLPAAWAYAFTRGVAPLGGPLTLAVGATRRTYAIHDALAYAAAAPMTEPVVIERPGIMRVRFRPGWVRFQIG